MTVTSESEFLANLKIAYITGVNFFEFPYIIMFYPPKITQVCNLLELEADLILYIITYRRQKTTIRTA
jgi:hypothetical protein